VDKIRLALKPYFTKILSEVLTDRPISEEDYQEFGDYVMDWLRPRMPLDELGCRIFCLYVGGESAEVLSSRFKVNAGDILKKIGIKREEFREHLLVEAKRLLVGGVKVRDFLEPIVKRLGRQAYHQIGELNGKESLRYLTDLGKLLGQMSGELVERKEVQVNTIESYSRLLAFKPTEHDEFRGIVVEPIVERRLLE
jgi:hypothetical protein